MQILTIILSSKFIVVVLLLLQKNTIISTPCHVVQGKLTEGALVLDSFVGTGDGAGVGWTCGVHICFPLLSVVVVSSSNKKKDIIMRKNRKF